MGKFVATVLMLVIFAFAGIGFLETLYSFDRKASINCPQTQKLIEKDVKGYGQSFKVYKCVNKDREEGDE